jgi:hypothetical protein
MTEKEKKTQSFSQELTLEEILLSAKHRIYREIKNPDPAKQNPEFMKLVEEAKALRKKQ